ncbi:LCP family protein [Thermoactinospora rubra]|uniref:LCP family protein n=1 Tax=Thermoactinospora rubra TaxID=1088767 RepID=UPI001F0B0D76|nr:LCP family protein [Thermoactinospora rubra]
MTGNERDLGLRRSLALTAGSAILWGVAHLATGRKRTGTALATVHLALVTTTVTVVAGFGRGLLTLAVQPGWLVAFTVAIAVVTLAWSAVIIWSFVLLRPAISTPAGHVLATGLAGALCVLVIAPGAYAARLAYLSREVVTALFVQNTAPVLAEDPWNGARRINVLLVGADSAPSRPGVRTDSMTVASVDTATGATVLFSLPRNLQHVPMPPGPARDRFPYGFTGETPYSPGLLNEVYQYAEDHPEIVPGVGRGRRGPTLLKQTISGILGIPVKYYAMIDMAGFAEIIDAMGGVRLTVKEPITYGKYDEGLVPAGTRRLSGEEALWYGRSRTDGDDYVRMGRQKCLLNAVAKQADPLTVLNSFEKLASATKRFVDTDIPQSLLPHLIELSDKVKGAPIRSLQFVPPLIDTVYPDWDLIRRKVDRALGNRPRHRAVTAVAPSAAPSAAPSGRPASGRPASGQTSAYRAVSLDEACSR